jgi:hypothetical protein
MSVRAKKKKIVNWVNPIREETKKNFPHDKTPLREKVLMDSTPCPHHCDFKCLNLFEEDNQICDYSEEEDEPGGDPRGADLILFDCKGISRRLRPHDVLLNRTHTLDWVTLPSLAATRNFSAAAFDNHKLYVVGGQREECLDTVDVMDLESRKWSVLPTTMSISRYSCAVVISGSRLIVIGGFNPNAAQACLSSVEVCDLTTFRWSALPDLPSPRWGCSGTMCGSNLIVMGGVSDTSNVVNDGMVFSFLTNSWSIFPAPMSVKRRSFGMAIEDRKLFVIGGKNCDGGIDESEMIELLDNHDQPISSTSSWTSLPPIPPIAQGQGRPFGHCSAASKGGKVFACFSEKMFVFDVGSTQWTEMPSHPNMTIPACFVMGD